MKLEKVEIGYALPLEATRLVTYFDLVFICFCQCRLTLLSLTPAINAALFPELSVPKWTKL